MADLKKLLQLIEDRLTEHDSNRVEVQSRLAEACSKMKGDVDSLEEGFEKTYKDFDSLEDQIYGLIEKFNDDEGNDLDPLIKQAQEILSLELKYSPEDLRSAGKKFGSLIGSDILVRTEKTFDFSDENRIEVITNLLQEFLDKLHEFLTTAQEKLDEIRIERMKEADEMGERINGKLEIVFCAEDARLQSVVKEIKEIIDSENSEEVKELAWKAKLTLLKKQKYSLIEEGDSLDNCDLNVDNEVSLTVIGFEERKPGNLAISFTKKGELSLSFAFFNENDAELLKGVEFPLRVEAKLWEDGHEEDTSKMLANEYYYGMDGPIYLRNSFISSTTYHLKIKIVHLGSSTQWSDETEFSTPDFSEFCIWKECPDYVDKNNKYTVDEENLRIATKIGNYISYSTVIGSTPLPLNQVTFWNIKILKSQENNGRYIYVGVAPFDINQDEDFNSDKCGWYLHCCSSKLCSGLPYSYDYPGKEYGPRKRDEEYVHTGDSVGVVMDASKGELSFVLNGVNLGVAYEGIPLDKPLVPCVLLKYEGDSVELDTSEVKETVVDSSIPVPSNITTKSFTWNSIILRWDAVEGASFYQIEVDGSKFWGASTASSFTKRGFSRDTEHNFRVRAVKGNSVSEWSDFVKERTQKSSDLSECAWKECPDNADENRKYSVDEENPRIVTKIGGNWSTIIGNTALPLNKVTSWSIKILKSKDNDGHNIFIGVAPSDIDQNIWDNFKKCGWYFYCYDSTLCSGPPHGFRNKKYNSWKALGEYVHTGDCVGVVMGTTMGDLSFVLNGMNLGVAYKGIPLDKPLVPCVLLKYKDDSIELDTSEVKENLPDSSIPIPSNITTQSGSITWDSITLTWDAVEGASFYQIEVNGSKFWGAPTTNTFTKRGLLPETEYTFRVRAVRGSTVSEWSDIVKGRTQKESFETSGWKECPDIERNNKYSVDEENLRIATKIGGWDDGYEYCTIIGNTPLPLSTVTSWSIKILKSRWNNGGDIFIGAGIDKDKKNGWYFDCYESILFSGPPHNYRNKEYGPRKGIGEYVHTGDSVGVVMDTTRGELSFVVNGVNPGVAYEGIPIDKPLVPCVVLAFRGDSVELVI